MRKFFSFFLLILGIASILCGIWMMFEHEEAVSLVQYAQEADMPEMQDVKIPVLSRNLWLTAAFFFGLGIAAFICSFILLRWKDLSNNTGRPLWLKIALACLSAWLAFLFSFYIYSAFIFSIIMLIYGTPDILGRFGFLIVVAIGIAALFTGYFAARWQHRLLASRSSRVSYVVLIILIILTILFLPSPFNYVVMD